MKAKRGAAPIESARRNIQADTVVKWRGIVKVQRSLFSTEGPTLLINSEDRSIFYMAPFEALKGDWFRKDEHKFYAEAELRGTLINLVRKVAEQDW